MYKRAFWVAAVVACFLCAGVGSASPQAGAAKVGVVDLQRCLLESKLGKKYKAEFTAKAEQAKVDLEKKEAALKELRENLEKQSLVLSPAAKAEKEKEYRDKTEAFQGLYKSTLQNLQKQDQELTGRVLKELQSIIKEIGESSGYTIIAERQEAGILYFGKEVDVTDELIRRYDLRAKD